MYDFDCIVEDMDCDVEIGVGTSKITAAVDVTVPHPGQCSAVVMPGSSVNVAGMGETCEDMGYHLY